MRRVIIGSVCHLVFASTVFGIKDPAPQYIAQFSEIAQKEMQRSGIPASIKMAQALLESESGKSPLAIEGNNHFGIKCGRDWQGKTYYKLDDDADQEGNIVESCFRAFETAEESFVAHSDFLTDPKKSHRYGILFTFDNRDYRAWAIGLREAGYASDPCYPDKLIRIIEKYNLSKLDEKVAGKKIDIVQNKPVNMEPQKNKVDDVMVRVKEKSTEIESTPSRLKTMPVKPDLKNFAFKVEIVNHQKAIIVSQPLTVENIATILQRKPTELIAFNEMLYAPDQMVNEGTYIYLTLKAKDYKGKEEIHKVAKGETVESIANTYGIRANTLYSLNRIPKGHQPLVNETINLKYKTEKNNKPKTSLAPKQAKWLFSMTSD